METNASKWTVSLVRGDLLFRLQRKIGLIPAEGLGVARRVAFWSLLGWLPIALWALHKGSLLPAEVGEPLFAHFGINVRLLIAVPLFIVAEGVMQSTLATLLPRLVTSGVVPPSQFDQLRNVLSGVAELRDSVVPWIVIATVLMSFFLLPPLDESAHELVWSGEEAGAVGSAFGAWWYLYVGRTIFMTLLLAWLWRLVLLFILFKRIAGLELSLVPTHPDACAGLGFLARIPFMFVPVVLGISSVLASGWAHQVVYHGAHVAALRVEMIAFVVVIPLLFLTPFISFMGLMLRTKKQSLLDYGDLISRHGRLVRERWIDGKAVVDEPILDAPELGPVADVVTPFELISKIRPLPLSMASVIPMVGAAALPMLVLAATEVPIADVLKAVLKMLV